MLSRRIRGRGRCSPGERESAVYGRGSQLNGAEWWGFERREGQPRSTSTAASDSVASRASSRRLVLNYIRSVRLSVTRLVFFFSFFIVYQSGCTRRGAPTTPSLFGDRRESVYLARARVSAISLLSKVQPHAWLRSRVIPLFRRCDGYNKRERERKRKKKCDGFPGISFADEPKSVVEKKWCFRRVQPTARARIDRERCWRPARISISVLNTSRRYLLRLVYHVIRFSLRRYLREVHYILYSCLRLELTICRDAYLSTFKVFVFNDRYFLAAAVYFLMCYKIKGH